MAAPDLRTRSADVRRFPRPIAAALVCLLTFHSLGPPGAARANPLPAESLRAVYRGFDKLPGMEKPAIARLWNEAIRLEVDEDFIAAARVFEEIIRELPVHSLAYWRAARSYWAFADRLRPDKVEERIRYFTLTVERAGRGLEIDPSCGGCYLYKFVGIASRVQARGILTGIPHAREMRWLLEQGIALQPTYADNQWNSTLGNLYYAASHFYRVTPEWFWLKWLIGVRGDHRLALDYARRAHAIAADRVDYQVTLGAALLCVANEYDDQKLFEEAIAVLKRVPTLPVLRPHDDPMFRRHAVLLLSDPTTACDYAPTGWVNVKSALNEREEAR